MLGGWPEPFGLVAIESMATGTPVIARRAGALIETIEHGESGFLVDDVDEAVLAVAARRRAGPAGDPRASALERFSPARMADEYVAAYRQVLAEVRSGRGGPPPGPANGALTGASAPSPAHTPVDDAADELRFRIGREPAGRA